MKIKNVDRNFTAEFSEKDLSTILCALYTLQDRIDHIDETVVQMDLDLNDLGSGFNYPTGPNPEDQAYPTVSFSQDNLSELQSTLSQLWTNT